MSKAKTQNGELQALALIPQIKQCHEECKKGFVKSIEWGIRCGEFLCQMKELAGHGAFGGLVEQYFEFSQRSAQGYMRLHKDLGALSNAQRAAHLKSADSVRGLQKVLPAPEATAPVGPAPESPQAPSTTKGPPEPPKASGASQPAAQEQARGRCPNCHGTKWDEDDEGAYCQKCHQPYGEPAGDVDEARVKTQRQKTGKTIEALMRAYDDLQDMKGRPCHGGSTKWKNEDVLATLEDMGVITACKGLLELAKGWM